jgi:hypothetical protein
MASIVLLSSCKSAIEKIDEAENSINKISAAGQSQGSQYADILNHLTKDLPAEAHELISNDLKVLTNDAVGASATGALCSVDVLKHGVSRTLDNLKLKLLRKKVMPIKPEFCTLSMASIDLNSDEKSRNTLSIYGFNLYNPDISNNLIQVALIGDNVKKQIDEKYIGRNTNYLLSVNLNSLAPELVSNKYNKIQLYWNGDSTKMPQALIQKWKPKTDVKEFTPTPITFIPPKIGSGDCDFDTKPGNPIVGNIHVEFNIQPTYVEARVHMDAMEFGGDNTHVGGPDNYPSSWSPWTRIYTLTKDNFEIQQLAPNTSSKQELLVDSQGQKLYFMGSGAVSNYTVDLDQPGCEAGTYTKVVVTFNQLSVILIEKRPL